MAGRGPAPKDKAKRTRRNAAPAEQQLPAAPKVKAPALPGARKYLAATRAWYATWASSPQAAMFTGTEWQRLHMLAPLVDLYFRKPAPNVLGEIRLNEAKLGATADDRLRLRWTIADPGDPNAAPTPPAAPSRRRGDPRLKLVEGGRA